MALVIRPFCIFILHFLMEFLWMGLFSGPQGLGRGSGCLSTVGKSVGSTASGKLGVVKNKRVINNQTRTDANKENPTV